MKCVFSLIDNNFFHFVQRITIPEIIENDWFQIDYVPACGSECDQNIQLDDVNAAFDSVEVIYQ